MARSPAFGSLDRREFLRQGAAAGVGVGRLPLARAAAAAERAEVRRYVTLGRTGLRISDIGFGSSRLPDDENVVRFALDRGVTYFDTAESYRGGQSETTLGHALRARRDQVVIASKVKCDVSSARQELMSALEGSLRRLQTDHVDVYFNHAVNDPARLANPEWYEFVEAAKRQGKLRFTGMSGHGGRLVECLDKAIDEDLVDVVLVGYNFGQDPSFFKKFTRRFDFVAIQPDLPRVLEKARAKGVGVVAMKTLMGARLNDLRAYEDRAATFSQAAFRWVLSNPDVDSLIVSMKSTDQIAEYLGASGWRSTALRDPELLERYAERNADSYCRHGCAACADACPHGVPISEVLRTRMYAVDYQDMELARADYALLEVDAGACLSCSERSCAGACPFGLPIDQLTEPAHRMLR